MWQSLENQPSQMDAKVISFPMPHAQDVHRGEEEDERGHNSGVNLKVFDQNSPDSEFEFVLVCEPGGQLEDRRLLPCSRDGKGCR